MLADAANVFFVHLLLAVILFFVANWLGRHSISSGYHPISLLESVDEAPAFNFVFRVATPLAYLAITAALLYAGGLDHYVRNFYFVVVYYFAVRWLYNIVVGRARLLKWSLQLGTAAVAVALAYLLDHKVLSTRGTLLPGAQGLSDNLWVLVIIYVYSVLNRVPFTHTGAARRRQDYILRRYHTLHEVFSGEISEVARDAVEEMLVYAVVIYETFNRPYVYRMIERWVLFPVGLSKTLGPMQVETRKDMCDRASVREGAKKLLQAFRRSLPAAEASVATWHVGSEIDRLQHVRFAAIRAAAQEYNVRSDYANEVESVYEVLEREVYKKAVALAAE